MTVIVSRKVSSRFYHRADCLFVTQIPQEDQLRLSDVDNRDMLSY